MSRRLRITPIAAVASALVLAACAGYSVTRMSVQSFDARSARVNKDQAFTHLTTVLVDRGFDVKNSSKDAGILTTEYKQFGAEGSSPPFDYYLQIRATIREDANRQVLVRLSPIVKEQNRLNAAAFTEHELTYYTGEPKAIRLISSMKPEGWRAKGQILFNNVVSDLSAKLGVSPDQIQQNVTRTQVNAFNAKDE